MTTSMWMGNTLMSTPNSKTRGWSSLAGLGQPRRFFFFLLSTMSRSLCKKLCAALMCRTQKIFKVEICIEFGVKLNLFHDNTCTNTKMT